MSAVISNFIFTLALGFYALTCLQWFSYRVERVLHHFTKPMWHLYFFIIPVLAQIAAMFCPFYYAALGVVTASYIAILALWHKGLDKKLVFTDRIKRAFAYIASFAVIVGIAEILIDIKFSTDIKIPAVIALFVGLFFHFRYEKTLFNRFKASALSKLNTMNNLIIVQITASYGKTSIKNFLYDILSPHFVCYKTPRSVNTLAGIVKDINDDLPKNTQVYIAEAGARLPGDIAEITEFLRPQIVVVGEIGAQHLEYFKSVENIRATKLEALNSPRLKHAFVHSSTLCHNSATISTYDIGTKVISSTLDGIKFSLKINDETFRLSAPVLGEFNAQNLSACVMVARFLGVNDVYIHNAVEKVHSVEHRLQKIENGGKIIIDDAFNGNLAGMLASYELCKTYKGNKVIVTPGIVESTKEDNEVLAKKIDEVFDLVIITGELNLKTLKDNINPGKVYVLKDKSKMVEILAKYTKAGDLVLFSNDAPNFI